MLMRKDESLTLSVTFFQLSLKIRIRKKHVWRETQIKRPTHNPKKDANSDTLISHSVFVFT